MTKHMSVLEISVDVYTMEFSYVFSDFSPSFLLCISMDQLTILQTEMGRR